MVKVSPDEDSDAQIEGICSAVWASGVDGVIVGNTTKKRPDPAPRGYTMPEGEEKLLTELGGYSGPQLFERTLDLVRRYRQKLDHGTQDDAPQPPPPTSKQTSPSPPPTSASSDLSQDPADLSVQRDIQRLKPLTAEAEKESSGQPLIQLPERHSNTSDSSIQDTQSAQPPPPTPAPSTPPTLASPAPASSSHEQKVIFATGGITNGEQCLQILNAGASVCQIYTAMMYGGVGTVTRMKKEMRDVIKETPMTPSTAR